MIVVSRAILSFLEINCRIRTEYLQGLFQIVVFRVILSFADISKGDIIKKGSVRVNVSMFEILLYSTFLLFPGV